MKIFSDFNTVLMEKALDAASMRQSAIADNIANVNTLGYKKKQVVFEEAPQQAMKSGNAG